MCALIFRMMMMVIISSRLIMVKITVTITVMTSFIIVIGIVTYFVLLIFMSIEAPVLPNVCRLFFEDFALIARGEREPRFNEELSSVSRRKIGSSTLSDCEFQEGILRAYM